MPDFEPTEAFARLGRDVRPDPEGHPVDLPSLGDYVVMFAQVGPDAAREAFPDVAAHLATDCPACAEILAEIAVETDATRRIARALDASAAIHPPADPSDPGRHLPPEIRRYRQRRWDGDVLADVLHLEAEFRHRRGEA